MAGAYWVPVKRTVPYATRTRQMEYEAESDRQNMTLFGRKSTVLRVVRTIACPWMRQLAGHLPWCSLRHHDTPTGSLLNLHEKGLVTCLRLHAVELRLARLKDALAGLFLGAAG
jgi:hypothetical protein